MNFHPKYSPDDSAAMIACIAAAGEVKARLRPPLAPLPVQGPPRAFTSKERALFRALSKLYPTEKCREMVISTRSEARRS